MLSGFKIYTCHLLLSTEIEPGHLTPKYLSNLSMFTAKIPIFFLKTEAQQLSLKSLILASPCSNKCEKDKCVVNIF